jgi:hypothetical protein
MSTLANIHYRSTFIWCALVGCHLTSASRETLAADFCAVHVRVVNPNGYPINNTWIELKDPSGRVVRREHVGPEFEICDFGFGPHTLTVGTNECLPMSISNLRVVIGRPLSLKVMMNDCGYRHDMRSACFVYFRTVGVDGRPIGGVEFSHRAREEPPATDSFGRRQTLLSGRRDVTFTKIGYAPTTVRVECKEHEQLDIEVVMKRLREPEAVKP